MLRFDCPHREERYASFRPFGPRLAVVALIGLASLGATVARGQAPVTQPALIARAVLPADTFAEGPRSGTRIDPPANNGRVAPFDRQPAQGISGILNGGDGTFLVLEDNGYGAKANSPDFNLRVYRRCRRLAPALDGRAHSGEEGRSPGDWPSAPRLLSAS